MTIEQILEGKQAIRNGATAWEIRTQNAPPIDPTTQPNLQRIIEKIAEKNGLTVQELQNLSFKQANNLK